MSETVRCDICQNPLFSYYDKNTSIKVSYKEKEYTVCPNCQAKHDITKGEENQEKLDQIFGSMIQKRKDEEEKQKRIAAEKARMENMILTTSSSIQNKEIIEYKGIVGAQVITGINIFKDIFSGLRNVVGGRSKQLQKSMKDMRGEY